MPRPAADATATPRARDSRRPRRSSSTRESSSSSVRATACATASRSTTTWWRPTYATGGSASRRTSSAGTCSGASANAGVATRLQARPAGGPRVLRRQPFLRRAAAFDGVPRTQPRGDQQRRAVSVRRHRHRPQPRTGLQHPAPGGGALRLCPRKESHRHRRPGFRSAGASRAPDHQRADGSTQRSVRSGAAAGSRRRISSCRGRRSDRISAS